MPYKPGTVDAVERVRRWRMANPGRPDTRLHRERYPDKYRARTAVGNAVRDGRLTREPCEACGTTERVEAHHDDYSKPLEVRWLCKAHHMTADAVNP